MTTNEVSNIKVFARALQPDEVLLWQFMPEPNYLNLGLRVLGLIIVLLLFMALMTVSTAVALGLATAFVIIVQGISWSRPQLIGDLLFLGFPAADEVYAVTNQRVLTHREAVIRALPLEKITAIQLVSSHRLRVEPDFPTWIGLEDASHIKDIIEQAQKERLKAGQA